MSFNENKNKLGVAPEHQKNALKSKAKTLSKTAISPSLILYRGDKVFTPFENLNRLSDFNNKTTESLVAFANTPGLYFTESKENALHYGKFLTIVKISPNSNILKMKTPISKQLVHKILQTNPKLSNVLSDYSENKIEAYRMLIDIIMKETDPIERLKSIWGDGQFSNSDFVNAMIKNKIDGIEVQKEGYKHYVIYNKNTLILQKQIEE
jgi:hypothetical protein